MLYNGLTKEETLVALYNFAGSVKMPGEEIKLLTIEKAKEIISRFGGYVGAIGNVIIKATFYGKRFEEFGYDQVHGGGSAKDAIKRYMEERQLE